MIVLFIPITLSTIAIVLAIIALIKIDRIESRCHNDNI